MQLGEVSRESCSALPTDELHLLFKSSETGLGYSTESTALLSGKFQFSYTSDLCYEKEGDMQKLSF